MDDSHAPSGADAPQEPSTLAADVRRLAPAALLVPVVLGALLYAGERAGWFGPAVGYALLVATTIGACVGLVLFYARRIDRAEAERRRAEAESAEAAPALAQRAVDLERANAELAAAKTQLERSNEELQRFATVASHDLRDPLRVVSGFAELLARRYGDQLEGEGVRFLDAITNGVARMDELIADLLDYARAGRGDTPREPVDLGVVVADVLANLEVAIGESNGVVNVDPLPTVTGDPRGLRQLFQNLIANAIKFGGDEPPRVSIWAADVPGGWRVTIRDNGIGIEPADAERIFGMFTRLHSAERYPGTGVGLAVCQRIVEVHGGRIWVEHAPGRGSQFMFTLAAGDERLDVMAEPLGLSG
jgi:light-regulated signal transduction histidine kinase (bacteriophytochrome)